MERYQLLCRESGWPTRNTITLRLGGSWRELMTQAATRTTSWDGPVRTHPRRTRERPSTAGEILVALADAGEANGGRLTVAQYRAWSKDATAPHPDIIRARFGSWAAACRAAGITAGRGGWTVLDVVRELQRGYAAIGEPFTAARFTAWLAKQPSRVAHLKPDTAIRLLGSWSRCQVAAGSTTPANEIATD
jgi:hypothetical protein